MIVGSNLNTNSTGVTWQCHIDGVLMTSILPTTPENNLLLCEPSGNQLDLTDGPHVITVNVTASDVRVFWFDYIQYIPSASVPLDHVALSIDAGYPQFQYGTGWGISQVPAGDGNLTTGNITAVTASTFGFDFEGDSFYCIHAIQVSSLIIFHYAQVSPLHGLDFIAISCHSLPQLRRMLSMVKLL
jgi:hypothetical protein